MAETPLRQNLSPRELARFLRRLARLYSDERTGNSRLASSLDELASYLMGLEYLPKDKIGSFSTQERAPIAHPSLSNLSLDEAQAFLAGPDYRTKQELVQLGIQRFSMAPARLKKLPRHELLAVIGSALRHEESLRIISSEAQRRRDDEPR